MNRLTILEGLYDLLSRVMEKTRLVGVQREKGNEWVLLLLREKVRKLCVFVASLAVLCRMQGLVGLVEWGDCFVVYCGAGECEGALLSLHCVGL